MSREREIVVSSKQIYHSADDLPAALAADVLTWFLTVADTKHRIGLQFSHWVTGTPALEAAVGSAAITQDELGHARSFYSLLRDFPGAPESIGAENDLEARDIYYAPAALMPRWDSWLQVVSICMVLDHALQIAIAQMQDSTFQPLAGRIAKITQEEKFHRVFAQSWLERLAQQDDQLKDRLQLTIDWAWSITNRWIGPDDDPVTSQLVVAGILDGGPAIIRRQWLAEVEPVLVANGLTIPDEEPDWSTWDARFRQGNHA